MRVEQKDHKDAYDDLYQFVRNVLKFEYLLGKLTGLVTVPHFVETNDRTNKEDYFYGNGDGQHDMNQCVGLKLFFQYFSYT